MVVEQEIKSEAEAIQDFESSHPAGWIETRGRKPRPGIVGVHCTICKKKFSTYGSMCRHRRSVHRVVKQCGEFRPVDSGPSSSPPPASVEEAGAWEDPVARRVMHIEASVEKMYQAIEAQHASNWAEEEELVFSPPPSPTSFYRNVADNIAENLSLYLDGGSEALKMAQQHVRADDYVPLDEVQVAQSMGNIDWSAYNFPQFFMPVDPIIPHPPAPPPPPTQLFFEGEKTPAYPTRSAVAEREASRRASVGATEEQKSGVKEKVVRRASVSALDKNKDEKVKMARRASLGSFDNGNAKETGKASHEVADGKFTVCADSKTEIELPCKLSLQNGESDVTKPKSLSSNQAAVSVVSADDLELKLESTATGHLVLKTTKRSKLVEKNNSTAEDLDDVFDNLSDVSAVDKMENKKSASGMENTQLPHTNVPQGKTSDILKNLSGMENAQPPHANVAEGKMTVMESTDKWITSDIATSQETLSVCTDVDTDKLCCGDSPSNHSFSAPLCEQRLLGEIVTDAGSCVLDTANKMEEDTDLECNGPDPLQNDSFRDSDLPSETSDSIKSTLSEQSDFQTSTSKMVTTHGCDKSAIAVGCGNDTKSVESDRSSSVSASPDLVHNCSFVTEVVSKEGKTFEVSSHKESCCNACSQLPHDQSSVFSMPEDTLTAAQKLHGAEESLCGNAEGKERLNNDHAVQKVPTVEESICRSVKKDEILANDNAEMGKISRKENSVTELNQPAAGSGMGQTKCVSSLSKVKDDQGPQASCQDERNVNTAESGEKESLPKSENSVLPLISKCAESFALNTSVENSSHDLGEKELEYLSKGAVFYVRGSQKHCPHLLNEVGVPARLLENEAEEDYVSKLELTVKKIYRSCAVKHPGDEEAVSVAEPVLKEAEPVCALKNPGDEETTSVSEPQLSAECDRVLDKKEQDPTQPHSSKEIYPESQHASVLEGAFTTANASDATVKKREQDQNLPDGFEGIPHDTHVGVSGTADQDDPEVLRERSVTSKMTRVNEYNSGLQTSTKPCSSEPPCTRSDVDSHLDPTSQSSSHSGQLHPASNQEDSDLDLEIVNYQAKLELQALQERVAIDREALDMCEHCQPQSTEHSEPSKRSAEDFMKMRFGRKYDVYSVCSMCRRYYHGVDSLLRHQWKKHPSIQCSHIEVSRNILPFSVPI